MFAFDFIKYMKIQFRHIVFPFIISLPLVIILANCARESRPTGGVKDTLDPKVVEEKPINNSQNVSPSKIVIKFDEQIVLEKIQDNCFISPPFKETPSITTHKKKIIIDLKNQTLQPNTTYNFTFSNAIKDLNEGNTINTYTYAFSTGNIIDSLRVSGKVLYANNLSAPKTAYVLLYDNLQDSAIKTIKPRYATQTKKDGSFTLTNIAAGTYKIYALEDANKDFIYNQANEKIAFYDSLIIPSAKSYIDTVWHKRTIIDTTKTSAELKDSFSLKTKTKWSHQDISLYLFENKGVEQTIFNNKRISKYKYGWKFSLNYTENDFSVVIPGYAKESFKVEFIPEKDSVILWLVDTNLIQAAESKILVYNKSQILDTLTLAYTKDLPARLACETSTIQTSVFRNDTVFWKISRPIGTFESANIQLYKVIDTMILQNSYGKQYVIDVTKKPIISKKIPPITPSFIPKYYYEQQEILSYKKGLNRFALYFSKPCSPEDISITIPAFPDTKNWYIAKYDNSTNSILVWITDQEVMKIKNLAIEVTFKNGKGISKKLIEFEPGFDQKEKYKSIKTGKLLAVITETQLSNLQLDNTIELIWNNPIVKQTDSLFTLIETTDSTKTSKIISIDTDRNPKRKLEINAATEAGKIYILHIEKNAITDVYGNSNKEMSFQIKTQKEISAKQFTIIDSKVIEHSSIPREYGITAQWSPNTNYAIVIPKNTYIDMYGASNDSCYIALNSPKQENYGSLQIKLPNNSALIGLTLTQKDEKKIGKPLYAFPSKNNESTFQNLLPGEYVLTAFYDVNNNKKWDSGSLEKHIQPEKIVNYTQPIIIKANWDNVIEWKLEQ